jgi:hypothetical protein
MPEEAPSGRGGVRGHRPSDRSVRPGLVAAPALLNALIHRSDAPMVKLALLPEAMWSSSYGPAGEDRAPQEISRR